MIKKKICMVGAEAVGKTSLVRRFVHGVFSDRYLTTLGVKIDKKIIAGADGELHLMLWDLAGEDELQPLRVEYLQGASGYLLVADGTRLGSFAKAVELQKKVELRVGPVPFVLIMNKADLRAQWFDLDRCLEEAGCQKWVVQIASAKDGTGVEEAFLALAGRISHPHPNGSSACN